jgi:hypothetical protein
MEPETTASGAPTRAKPGLLESLFGGFRMPSFSFGGIFSMLFTGLFIAVGAYFLMKIPGVRQFVEDLLPDDIQAWLDDKLGKFSPFQGFAENFLTGLEAKSDDPNQRTAQSLLISQGVSPELAEAIAPDTAQWREFIQLVKDANGSIGQDEFISDKTIRALITQKPQIAQRIIAALPRPGASTDDKAKQFADKIKASVVRLVQDDTALAALLGNDQSRALTMQALAKFAPIEMNPEALDRFVKATGMDGNTVKPELKNLLTALAGGSADANAMFEQYMITAVINHPAETKELLGTLNPEAIQDAGLKQIVNLAGDNRTFESMATMARTLGPEKMQLMVNAFKSENVAQSILTLAAQDAQFKNAVIAFVDNAGANIPAEWKSGVDVLRSSSQTRLNTALELDRRGVDLVAEYNTLRGINGNPNDVTPAEAMDYIFNPENRSKWYVRNEQGQLTTNNMGALGGLMRDQINEAKTPQEKTLFQMLGTTRPGPNPNTIVYPNIGVIFNFIDKIERHNRSDEQSARMVKIGMALVKFASNPKDTHAFEGVNARDLQDFFKDNTNRAEFRAMIKNLDTSGMPQGRERTMLEAVKKNWDAIATILADDSRNFFGSEWVGVGSGAEQLLNALQGKGSGPININTSPDWVLRGALDDSVYNNLAAVREVMRAVEGQAPAAPRPAAHANRRQ